MSYQVLARKWRPKTFADMVGQEHVLRALMNGLESGRLHHAFLFTGTRGVGKTTVARILAKCLNCEQGVSAQPCGVCSTCQEIDQGRFVDLIEVDAASRTKVEDTRELLDNVQYAPTRGRYKIYLIDEIHMLSGHSFNALLKTLEEPPPHVKFLVATTDPQKIPVTILSRCLQFSLKRLPVALIQQHLAHILEVEGVAFEAPALAAVARAADGSMRDALSLLDQAIAFGGGAVREADVRAMLGSLERDFLFDLLEALADQDGAGLMQVVERMAEQAPDFGAALAEMLSLLHQLSLAQTVPEAVGDDVDPERLQALAVRLSPEDIQLFYQIALIGRRDLPLAPEPRTGFEMVLLRMLAFRPASLGGSGTTPAGASQRPMARPSAPPPSQHQPPQPSTAPRPTSPPQQARPAPGAAQPAPQEAPTSNPELPQAAATTAPAEDDGEVHWGSLIQSLGLKGIARALAMHCEWLGREGGKVRLRLEEGHAHLRSELVEERMENALSDHFGTPVKIEFEIGRVESITPAEQAEQARAERQRQAVESIHNDPNVAAMREAFEAEVIENTIEPKSST